MKCVASHSKKTVRRRLRRLHNFFSFAFCFCMEIPHFECSWLIGEEICLSRSYQFSFNINAQLFLQEIAILFIYYLFIALLDLTDFQNEKPFLLCDWLFLISFSSPFYFFVLNGRLAADNGQKLNRQIWSLWLVCSIILRLKTTR